VTVTDDSPMVNVDTSGYAPSAPLESQSKSRMPQVSLLRPGIPQVSTSQLKLRPDPPKAHVGCVRQHRTK